MKKVFITILIVSIFTSMFGLDKANNFTLKDARNRNISLSDYLEKGLVVVDFWASWCSPCKKELPHLNDIHNKYDNVNVIAISTDKARTMNKAKNYLRQKKYDVVGLYDPSNKVKKAFGAKNVPHTFILAPDGSVLYEHEGYKTGDEEHMVKIIEKWLKESKKK